MHVRMATTCMNNIHGKTQVHSKCFDCTKTRRMYVFVNFEMETLTVAEVTQALRDLGIPDGLLQILEGETEFAKKTASCTVSQIK